MIEFFFLKKLFKDIGPQQKKEGTSPSEKKCFLARGERADEGRIRSSVATRTEAIEDRQLPTLTVHWLVS
ncbi:Uncharacterized protein APZ42_020635 [Daphnia magna]|uniref:Uncharacterized protein n=1 Tax=Daphnia magna TaxID=35525 RepID=A0A164X9P6_9CRUS|nr:Uncharacterized protein APZ42_020635 [Daphnia magna]